MKSGNRFPLEISRLDIALITENSIDLCAQKGDLTDFIKAGASYEDIRTASVLMALREFLLERRCEPDFKVVLSE